MTRDTYGYSDLLDHENAWPKATEILDAFTTNEYSGSLSRCLRSYYRRSLTRLFYSLTQVNNNMVYFGRDCEKRYGSLLKQNDLAWFTISTDSVEAGNLEFALERLYQDVYLHWEDCTKIINAFKTDKAEKSPLGSAYFENFRRRINGIANAIKHDNGTMRLIVQMETDDPKSWLIGSYLETTDRNGIARPDSRFYSDFRGVPTAISCNYLLKYIVVHMYAISSVLYSYIILKTNKEPVNVTDKIPDIVVNIALIRHAYFPDESVSDNPRLEILQLDSGHFRMLVEFPANGNSHLHYLKAPVALALMRQDGCNSSYLLPYDGSKSPRALP